MKFNNKMKPVVEGKPKTKREELLETIKRIKETGDMANSSSDYNDFLDYMKIFYGKDSSEGEGIYANAEWLGGALEDFEIEEALEEFLTNPQNYSAASDFYGDSVDREYVRDIALAKRKARKAQWEAEKKAKKGIK